MLRMRLFVITWLAVCAAGCCKGFGSASTCTPRVETKLSAIASPAAPPLAMSRSVAP